MAGLGVVQGVVGPDGRAGRGACFVLHCSTGKLTSSLFLGVVTTGTSLKTMIYLNPGASGIYSIIRSSQHPLTAIDLSLSLSFSISLTLSLSLSLSLSLTASLTLTLYQNCSPVVLQIQIPLCR